MRHALCLGMALAVLSTTAAAGRRRGIDQQPAAGPARGRRGHPRLLDRLRGRRLLRQRLAHHRRDGRHLGAAAEARRRPLVRRRRPVDRPGDEVHQRPGLRPLRPAATQRTRPHPHRLRARRPARRAVRPAPQEPGERGQDRHGQGRRPLRADDRLPVGLDDAVGLRQRPGRRRLRGRRARLPRRRALRRRRVRPHAHGQRRRHRLPRPAHRHRLPGRRQGRPVHLRRRPVRQGRGRRARATA